MLPVVAKLVRRCFRLLLVFASIFYGSVIVYIHVYTYILKLYCYFPYLLRTPKC